MQISIIIPTYNEAENIGQLIDHLKQMNDGTVLEIIVTDGGSIDNTLAVAKEYGAIAVLSPCKGRAAQMNYGASIAAGDILYFIHADTFPPPCYCSDIRDAINHGYKLGRYRTKFKSKSTLLIMNAFFTRFDLFMCYGGDQTLFVAKDVFIKLNGFNEQMLIMEDYDIIVRAKQIARYKIIQKDALISARKYKDNGWFKVQKANYTIVQMYKKGSTQQQMVDRYRVLLNYR